MPRKLNKSQRLMMVHDALNYRLERSGRLHVAHTAGRNGLGNETVIWREDADKQTDARRAVDLIERETGVSFGEVRSQRVRVPGTRDKLYSTPSNDPDMADAGVIVADVSPQDEIADELSAYYSVAPLTTTGHSISVPLNLYAREIMHNGEYTVSKTGTDAVKLPVTVARSRHYARLNLLLPEAKSIPNSDAITWEFRKFHFVGENRTPAASCPLTPAAWNGPTIQQSYPLPLKRPQVSRPIVTPRWETDVQDLRKTLHSWDVFLGEHVSNPVVVNPQYGRHTTSFTFEFSADKKTPAARLMEYQLIAKYRARNEALAEVARNARMSDLAEIQRDTAKPTPIHPSVSRPTDLDSLGLARPVFRPKEKWFHANPPALAMRAR